MNVSSKNKYIMFKKPRVVGYFSIDEKDNILSDISELKYLYPKRNFSKTMDLNIGMENVVTSETNHKGTMDHILENFLNNKERFISRNASSIRFICSRSVLVAVAMSPFQHPNNKVRVAAAHFKGDIYLCVLPNGVEYNNNNKIPSHWGYKFEQYMLTHDPDVEPITDVPVNEIAHFFFMLAGSVGDHKILYAAETDGKLVCEGDKGIPIDLGTDDIIDTLQKATFVELKTSSSSHKSNIKILKWYLQSKFGGIDNILCGSHINGLLQFTEDYKVDDLVSSLHNVDPGVCLKFCDDFLTHIENTFKKMNFNNTEPYYLQFELNKKTWHQINNVTKNEMFLPAWFINGWN